MFSHLLFLLRHFDIQLAFRKLSLVDLFGTALLWWIATWSWTTVLWYVAFSCFFGCKWRFPACQCVIVPIFRVVVPWTWIGYIFLVGGYFFDFSLFTFSRVTVPSFFGLGSGRFIFLVEVETRSRWVRVFPPLSLFFGYERTVSFTTMTDIDCILSLPHLIFHLLLSLHNIRHVVRTVEPLLTCTESFLFLVSINYGLVVGGNAADGQFSKCVLHASFVDFAIIGADSLIAKVELSGVKIGRISKLVFCHRNVNKKEQNITSEKYQMTSAH